MATQKELDKMYLECAISHSRLSKAIRLKVGALIVTTDSVMLGGYNGTPIGHDNCCEDTITDENGTRLVTKNTVIHAELNSILKAARKGVSVVGGTLYLTDSPCMACSVMIYQAGIKRVVYIRAYRDLTPVDLLCNMGVVVERFDMEI